MKESRVKADLVIRNIGQLLTLAGHSHLPLVRPNESSLGIQTHSAIASISGKICYVGSMSRLSESVNSTSAVELDVGGKLVLPGFVDCHTHAIFAGSREDEIGFKLSGLSYLEILKRGGGILRTVMQTRKATSSELIAQTKDRLDRMISFGTTTFEIKTGYGLSLKDEIRLLELIGSLRTRGRYDIVPTLLSAHAIPKNFGKADKYIDTVVLPSIDFASKKHLANFCDVFMEDGVFDRRSTERILLYGRKKGLGLKIHADEFTDLGGALLGAILRVTSVDHLMRASMKGMRALARSVTSCVLLPGTSLASFASSHANARALIDFGAPVALGSDMSPNSWIESMQFVISLACFRLRMTPSESIVGATINGAHAIGRARDVGSIEKGKSCDLLICNVSGFEEIPYRIASNSVRTVVKRGRIIREN
ncbi:MAG TPA: imidazolonepropionase [Nitrososphaerales archaeon]|nr:imidazolonepropionase [Nitrososphaerales archaeon]